MGPNSGRVKSILSSQSVIGNGEMQKSITFHDFCELTQRQLAEFSFAKSQCQRKEFTITERNSPQGLGSIIQENVVEKHKYVARTNSNNSIFETDGSSSTDYYHTRWRHSPSSASQNETIIEENEAKMASSFRKRPTNTFSAWLQLFLAKRRQRHNRYFASGNSQQILHQSCCNSFSGPNGGPLRSSVSLC